MGVAIGTLALVVVLSVFNGVVGVVNVGADLVHELPEMVRLERPEGQIGMGGEHRLRNVLRVCI